jgi:hypothetical protein
MRNPQVLYLIHFRFKSGIDLLSHQPQADARPLVLACLSSLCFFEGIGINKKSRSFWERLSF